MGMLCRVVSRAGCASRMNPLAHAPPAARPLHTPTTNSIRMWSARRMGCIPPYECPVRVWLRDGRAAGVFVCLSACAPLRPPLPTLPRRKFFQQAEIARSEPSTGYSLLSVAEMPDTRTSLFATRRGAP